MSWDNISKSLGSVIDERLSNPLVSTFAISWSIINWKFFVVLFSDNTATHTFALIEKHCYPTANDFWGWAVALPIAATLAYTYLLPYISNPFLRDWRTNQQKVNGIKDTLPIESVLTLKESLEIRKQQTELENTNNTMRTEIQGLRTQLFAAQDKVVELENIKESMDTVRQESKDVRALLHNKNAVHEELRVKFAALHTQYRRVETEYRTLMQFAYAVSNRSHSIIEAIQKQGQKVMRGFHTPDNMPSSNWHMDNFDLDAVFRGSMIAIEERLGTLSDPKDDFDPTPLPSGPLPPTVTQTPPSGDDTLIGAAIRNTPNATAEALRRSLNPVNVKAVINPRDSATKK